LPWVAKVSPGQTVEAPVLHMRRHAPAPLPTDLHTSLGLTLTASAVVTTEWPAGSAAVRRDYRFVREGVTVDTVRLFTPVPAVEETGELPLLLLVYPSDVDGWQNVSVAFAAQGAAVVAISPVATRVLDMDGHAQDARVALHAAMTGGLDPNLGGGGAVVLGGSFSSAIVHRLLRDEPQSVRAVVSVGGIADAFQGTSDFYAGRLEIPPQHALAVPALGLPNLLPLPFLRLSPIYSAGEMPPTLIIHTAADKVIPISQAHAMEDALRTAGVPVEAYYYEDASHYIQIGPDITEAGKSMFWRILDFVERHASETIE
jgi:pimeloyl-ACP methyl ester carboxylesterase